MVEITTVAEDGAPRAREGSRSAAMLLFHVEWAPRAREGSDDRTMLSSSPAMTPTPRRKPPMVRRVELALLHGGYADAATITPLGWTRLGVRLSSGLSDRDQSRVLSLIDGAMGAKSG